MLKRTLDVIVSLDGLFLTWPLMLAIAVIIKLTSSGPVFYRASRVGKDGRIFKMYKFRTMRADPESTLQIWARPNDSRVTAIGRVLRKYRLDELPELINVLRGEMNIVGPRPEQPKIFMELREQVPGYPKRQRQTWVVLSGLQCVYRLARNVQTFSQVCLRPTFSATEFPNAILHRYLR